MIRLAASSADEAVPEHLCRMIRENRLGEVGRLLRERLVDAPDCGTTWRLLGLVEHGERRWASAVNALEEASLRIPLDALAECALAEAYARLGKLQWALDLLSGVASSRGVPASVLSRAAKLCDQMGCPSLAITFSRRVLASEPESSRGYFDLSCYLARSGAPDSQVEATIRRAVSLEPDEMVYRAALVGFLVNRMRPDEAYRAIAGLSHEGINQLDCRRCLGCFEQLYQQGGDCERAAWCVRRIERLNATGAGESGDDGDP